MHQTTFLTLLLSSRIDDLIILGDVLIASFQMIDSGMTTVVDTTVKWVGGPVMVMKGLRAALWVAIRVRHLFC